MINKNNFLHHINSQFRGHKLHDKRISNPARDWFIGLLLFLVTLGIGGAYSAHMFVSYRNLNTKGGDYEELLVRYNQKLVQEVLSVYKLRKNAYDALQASSIPSVIVIPPVVEKIVSTSTELTNEEEAATSSVSSSTESVQLAN